MSKLFNYLTRDGKGTVTKKDEVVTTKDEAFVVRADDLERIKQFLNNKVDNQLVEGTDITEDDTHWTNETELKALLTSGDLVNIATTQHGSIAGIVSVLEDKRITMVGLYLAPRSVDDNVGAAEILFDDNGKVTAINVQANYLTQAEANSLFIAIDLSNSDYEEVEIAIPATYEIKEYFYYKRYPPEENKVFISIPLGEEILSEQLNVQLGDNNSSNMIPMLSKGTSNIWELWQGGGKYGTITRRKTATHIEYIGDNQFFQTEDLSFKIITRAIKTPAKTITVVAKKGSS